NVGAVLVDDFDRYHGRVAWRSVFGVISHGVAGISAVSGAVAGAVGVPGHPGFGFLLGFHRVRADHPIGPHAILVVRHPSIGTQHSGAGSQHLRHRPGVSGHGVLAWRDRVVGSAGTATVDHRRAGDGAAFGRNLRAVSRYSTDRQQRHADRVL